MWVGCEPGEGLAGQIGDRFGEGWRGIEGFGAFEPDAELGGVVAEGNVDVVEDFDVVAEEADGIEDKGFDALGGDGIEHALDSGTDPGTAAGPLTLKGKPPARNFRDQLRD